MGCWTIQQNLAGCGPNSTVLRITKKGYGFTCVLTLNLAMVDYGWLKRDISSLGTKKNKINQRKKKQSSYQW